MEVITHLNHRRIYLEEKLKLVEENLSDSIEKKKDFEGGKEGDDWCKNSVGGWEEQDETTIEDLSIISCGGGCIFHKF